MHKYILLIITLLASSLQSTATTFYSTSSTATLANGGAPSNGWTLNPNGITGIGLQIIFEDDDIVLLNGASVEAAGGAQIANLTINGNCYISGSFEVRYTTTLNAGILTLGEATLQFGVGDNNTNAGKILGNPNGTTIGIDASFSDAYITFRGGNFTSFSPANIITIPNGTFIGNTISYLDINTFSLFGQYQIELNTAITITETLSISNGVLKTSTDANKKLLIDVNGYIYGTYQNPTEYGYVLGTLYRNTNAINTYEFPVAGSPSNFISPAIITGSASPSTFAMSSVDYELAENNPLSNMPKCNGSNLISVQAGLQYNIERVTGTADAAVRLHYFQKPYYYWSGGSGVAPTNIHRLVMAHYNTTSNCWERVSTQSQNGDVADAKITSDELTNFSQR